MADVAPSLCCCCVLADQLDDLLGRPDAVGDAASDPQRTETLHLAVLELEQELAACAWQLDAHGSRLNA